MVCNVLCSADQFPQEYAGRKELIMEEARYWETVVKAWNAARPQTLWRLHSDAVNLALVACWPAASRRRISDRSALCPPRSLHHPPSRPAQVLG
jgi:hypothetical protein